MELNGHGVGDGGTPVGTFQNFPIHWEKVQNSIEWGSPILFGSWVECMLIWG